MVIWVGCVIVDGNEGCGKMVKENYSDGFEWVESERVGNEWGRRCGVAGEWKLDIVG